MTIPSSSSKDNQCHHNNQQDGNDVISTTSTLNNSNSNTYHENPTIFYRGTSSSTEDGFIDYIDNGDVDTIATIQISNVKPNTAAAYSNKYHNNHASSATGCLSFAASLTIIVMIARPSVKLSTTYHRLIFGISVFDLIQSLTQASSSLPMPAGVIWDAIGNSTTCDIQEFLTVIKLINFHLFSVGYQIQRFGREDQEKI